MEIDDENVWVGWQDSHRPGLKALIKEEQMKLDGSLKVMANKHANSTSTVQ